MSMWIEPRISCYEDEEDVGKVVHIKLYKILELSNCEAQTTYNKNKCKIRAPNLPKITNREPMHQLYQKIKIR